MSGIEKRPSKSHSGNIAKKLPYDHLLKKQRVALAEIGY
jgi:hypothetical protein